MNNLVERSAIDELQSEMAQMPQAPAMDTTHFFAGGMYCRRMEIPAGTVIVSKVHKTEHHFIGCVGQLFVSGQGENFIVNPGDVIPSPVGTKRAVCALTDVVVLTVHKTDETSPEALEKELMDIDGPCLYDAENRPKAGVLTTDSMEALKWSGQQPQ